MTDRERTIALIRAIAGLDEKYLQEVLRKLKK